MTSTSLTVRIDATSGERLDRLAERTGRSPSALVAEAIDAYLELDDWRTNGVNAAISALDHGQGIRHADLAAWVESWDSPSELPPPGKPAP